MTRVTVTGNGSSNKDVLAVSVCEAEVTNDNTIVGKVVTHKLQVEGMDGEDAEAVEQFEQSNTVNEVNNSSSMCPQHASPSSYGGITNEVPTGVANSEREEIVKLQKKVTHKKRRRKRKAAKGVKKKVTVKKKQIVPHSGENLFHTTTTNDLRDDPANNQTDKEDLCDQKEALDGRTEQSCDQKLIDHDELARQEGRMEESDAHLDGQAEVGNHRELVDQSEELANQKGLENQKEELDGQMERLHDQAEIGKLGDQSEELADQCGLEHQTGELHSQLEGLDDHAEVSQNEGNQSKLLVDQNKEQGNQSGLDDQREHQGLDDQMLGNQIEDSDSQTEDDQSEVLHEQKGSVATRKHDTPPAITTITTTNVTTITTTITTSSSDSSDTGVTDNLQEDNINGGMEAVDVTSKDPLPSQTPIDNQPQLPNIHQQSSLPSASCENEVSLKTSQCNDSALAMRQEIDEHSKDSNVTTMLSEEQKQHSAVKLPSAQGNSKKGLSKRKKGRRRPKKPKPQTVLVQEKNGGRGRPREVVVQEVPDSTAVRNDSTVSKKEENNEEPLISSTSRADEVSSSHDASTTVTHDDQLNGAEMAPAHPGLSPPDIVTSTSSNTYENTTTCNVLPEDSSITNNSPSDHEVTGGSQPSPCNTDKRLGKNKPGYRGLRKRQSTAATVASATKKLKFDEVEIKQESSSEKDNNELFPIAPSVGPTIPTLKRQRKRGKSTMVAVKSEITSSSEQEMVITRVAPGVAPLATVNRWAYQ